MMARGSRFKALREPVTPEAPLLALRRDADTALEWKQPRWDQYLYRLESSRGLLALIQTVGVWKLQTTARTAAGTYRIDSQWSGGFRLYFADEDAPRIEYRPGWWWSGKLKLRDGEVLRMRYQSLSRYVIETQEGFVLANFCSAGHWFRSGAEVAPEDALWRRDDALELLVMGFAVQAITTRRAAQ